MTPIDQKRLEVLSPAERVVSMLSTFTDHLIHNRTGIVVKDPTSTIGVKWSQATKRIKGSKNSQERTTDPDGAKIVLRCDLVNKKTVETRIGLLGSDGKTIYDGGRVVAEFRQPGIYPEVATFLYQQVADVFDLDAEFAAHWASWVFSQDRRDLKTVLAAFMLVQRHSGQPIRENGQIIFHDDDYRAVGEAMLLIRQPGQDLSPKQILMVGKVLRLPGIHAINRKMGFGNSDKNPTFGRFKETVRKWLRFREQNPKMLQGLVKSDQASIVKDLCALVGYKPLSPEFFKILRYKQKQSRDGRRTIALDMVLEACETWENLTEAEICERITAEKPGWKGLVGRLPSGIGLTRAIFAAAVESGCLSNKDLVILTPTIEELGLTTVEPVASAWRKALGAADDQRAKNIARNVKTQEVGEALAESADKATAKAIEKVTRDLRIYFLVDKSGSMEGALEGATSALAQFVGGFPLDRTHVAVFNDMGAEVEIKAPRSAAVKHAFEKHRASGGTAHDQGVRVLSKYQPKEDEDVLFIFVGDGDGIQDSDGQKLAATIKAAKLRPSGFIWGQFKGNGGIGMTITNAATILGIPCAIRTQFEFQQLFNDPYAVTQTLTSLLAATPVGDRRNLASPTRRETLVELILKTPLLVRPTWAEVT